MNIIEKLSYSLLSIETFLNFSKACFGIAQFIFRCYRSWLNSKCAQDIRIEYRWSEGNSNSRQLPFSRMKLRFMIVTSGQLGFLCRAINRPTWKRYLASDECVYIYIVSPGKTGCSNSVMWNCLSPTLPRGAFLYASLSLSRKERLCLFSSAWKWLRGLHLEIVSHDLLCVPSFSKVFPLVRREERLEYGLIGAHSIRASLYLWIW